MMPPPGVFMLEGQAMLWGWLGGIAPEKKQQEGVHTATVEWSPDELFARIDELERRLKLIETVADTKAVQIPTTWLSPAEFTRQFPQPDGVNPAHIEGDAAHETP